MFKHEEAMKYDCRLIRKGEIITGEAKERALADIARRIDSGECPLFESWAHGAWKKEYEDFLQKAEDPESDTLVNQSQIDYIREGLSGEYATLTKEEFLDHIKWLLDDELAAFEAPASRKPQRALWYTRDGVRRVIKTYLSEDETPAGWGDGFQNQYRFDFPDIRSNVFPGEIGSAPTYHDQITVLDWI